MYSGVVCGMSSSHWHVIASNAGRHTLCNRLPNLRITRNPQWKRRGQQFCWWCGHCLLSKGGEDQETFCKPASIVRQGRAMKTRLFMISGSNAQSNFPWFPSCSTGGCGCASCKGEKGRSMGGVNICWSYQRYITSFQLKILIEFLFPSTVCLSQMGSPNILRGQ